MARPPAAEPRPPARQAALSRIRLRHLQCFLAVAQFGTLRRAAEALAITQPAVTKTLSELEALLGKTLFVRGRQGATPTPDAERFMRHAVESVNALGEAVESVLRPVGVAALRIGALPTVAPAFLPGVLERFAAQWPDVGVQVTTGRNADLLARLRGRELDAVIGRLADPELMTGLSFEPLYAEPLVIALRPGHPLAPKPPGPAGGDHAAPALPALAAHPFVLPPAGTLIRQVADGFLARHGVAATRGSVETLDTALARALLLHGDHLWFTPLGAVQPDFEAGTLTRLAAELRPEEPVGLVLRTEPLVGAAVQSFVDAVRERAKLRRSAAGRA